MTSSEYPIAVSNARRIIKDLYITDPSQIDITAIAMERGAFVREKNMASSVGRLISKGNNGIIILSNNIREIGKKRFTIAHELGHFELHKKYNQLKTCTNEDLQDYYKTQSLEYESNVFAAELLMPLELFQNECKKYDISFNTIKTLTEVFKTSLTSTAIRYVELGPYPCAIIASESGFLKWFKTSEDFKYRIINLKSQVSDFSCAKDFFKEGYLEEVPNSVLAKAWLDDTDINPDSLIREHSISLPSYNIVLSLIWY